MLAKLKIYLFYIFTFQLMDFLGNGVDGQIVSATELRKGLMARKLELAAARMWQVVVISAQDHS